MNEAKIIAALNGYKDGSYGSAMKGVMKPIASGLSAEDEKAVAATIASTVPSPPSATGSLTYSASG